MSLNRRFYLIDFSTRNRPHKSMFLAQPKLYITLSVLRTDDMCCRNICCENTQLCARHIHFWPTVRSTTSVCNLEESVQFHCCHGLINRATHVMCDECKSIINLRFIEGNERNQIYGHSRYCHSHWGH